MLCGFGYSESNRMPDLEIPDFSILGQLKEAKPIVMYCITMYQEDFTQFVQSFTGCIRSIMELKKSDEQKYSPDRFGIVLIVDGIDKLPKEFALKLKEFNLFDEEVCYTATMTMNVNDDFVKKKFSKSKTCLNNRPEGDGRELKYYSYACQNVAHIFSK